MALPLILGAAAALGAGVYLFNKQKAAPSTTSSQEKAKVYAVNVASSKSPAEIAQYLSNLPGSKAVIAVTATLNPGSWMATLITTNAPAVGGNADFKVLGAQLLPADAEALLKKTLGG